jgi:uncharacterized protein
MKLLIVLLAIAAGLWLWRSGRGARLGQSDGARKPVAPVVRAMVACGVCQLHIAQEEALVGKKGHYCCAAHRQQAEP